MCYNYYRGQVDEMFFETKKLKKKKMEQNLGELTIYSVLLMMIAEAMKGKIICISVLI
ncbi:MAG: hypothetical protein ACJAX4_004533 [Clostridium sp.]|jgi:hypothetical protein